MRIGILTGTRPDIIKMAPLYWEARKRGHEPVLVHTGQHWSPHLFGGVYKDLELPEPSFKCGYGSPKSPADSVAQMMGSLDKLLRSDLKNLDILLTHGDTLTALAGSLAAHLNVMAVGHVEAGLRTFSREPFPEQTDTRCSDACSDIFFAPTETNRKNLLNEGFDAKRIFLVGNTVVDAAKWAAKKGERAKPFFEKLEFDFSKPQVYFSCHRRETTMHAERFTAVAEAMCEAADSGYQVLWSVRPGTQKAIDEYGLAKEIARHENLITVTDIPNYTDIMFYVSRCRMVVTDSGSMQEESAALHVPCVTLRYVTDRPESVEAGVNLLAPPKSADSIMRVVRECEKNNDAMRKKRNPYGEGDSSKRIIGAMEKFGTPFVKWEHERGEGGG